MKRLLITLLLLGLLAGTAGCQQAPSPEARLYVAAQTCSSTVRLLREYANIGLLDEEDVAELAPYVVACEQALDAWRRAQVEGVPVEEAIRDFQTNLNALLVAKDAAEAKRRAP